MASVIFQEILKEVTFEQRANVRLSLALTARIHELMNKYNVNRATIADKMESSLDSVDLWLSGTHTFSLDTLVRLENILGEPIIRVAVSTPKTTNTRKHLNLQQAIV